jgi:hypothetical protein
MRSDGLASTKQSNHNRLMFISQERVVQDMYDVEQQPDLEVDKSSIMSSTYLGSILVPPYSEREVGGSSPLVSPPTFLRLEPNRRKPDADEPPQRTRIPSPPKDRLSISDSSHRRVSRLSRFFKTFKSPIGINFAVANFAHHVANSRLLCYSRCSGPARTRMTGLRSWHTLLYYILPSISPTPSGCVSYFRILMFG